MDAESRPLDRSRFGYGAWVGVAVTLAGVALIAVLVLTVDPLRDAVSNAVSGDTDELRDELRDLGAAGPIIAVALCLIHAFVWYPSEIVDTAAGFVFGFWAAVPLVMAGWILNAIVTYWLGRVIAGPIVAKAVGYKRFAEAERLIAGGGVTLLLAVRLVPIVPFSFTGYIAGAARVPAWRFVWTTAVGYLPITIIFVYLGSRLDSLSATDPAILAGAAVLVLLLLFARKLRLSAQAEGRSAGAADGCDG
jgi:uncharacterized membrane protein YdjX (TVP38/TMEM64 family)